MIRNLFNKISKEIVHRNLSGVSKGTLIITEGKQKYRFGFDSSLTAEITVNNPSFYSEVLLGGSIGASEAFIHKSWSSRNLTKVIQFMVEINQLWIKSRAPLNY